MTEEMLRLLAAQRREKKDLLLCIDRAWGQCARQARQARRRLRRLEGVLALTTDEIKLRPEASVPPDEPRPGETQLEALTRRLAQAHQEIKQYETKLFACERTILSLKKENAELTALCNKARELGFAPADEEARGPFWPDGEGPAPAEALPPPSAAQEAEGEDAPSWLDAPMELLESPEPRTAPGKEARRKGGPLDEITSQVLGQLDLLMEQEHIPLKRSSYLHDRQAKRDKQG